jgi:energy-coupling factor transport system permease protein
LLLCFNDAAYTGALFLVLLAISFWVGAGSTIVRFAVPILILVSLSVLTWSVHVRGSTVIWSGAGVEVSAEALNFGMAMGFRLAGMLIAGIVLLATTPLNDFYAGLVLLKLPQRLAFTFALTLAFLPRYMEFALAVLDVQVARGLNLRRGGIIRRVRQSLALGLPIFVHLARQTQIRAIALEARAFSPGLTRSFFGDYSMRRRDWIALAAMVLLLALSAGFHVAGYGYIRM